MAFLSAGVNAARALESAAVAGGRATANVAKDATIGAAKAAPKMSADQLTHLAKAATADSQLGMRQQYFQKTIDNHTAFIDKQKDQFARAKTPAQKRQIAGNILASKKQIEASKEAIKNMQTPRKALARLSDNMLARPALMA